MAIKNTLPSEFNVELKRINVLNGKVLLTNMTLTKDNHSLYFPEGVCHISWPSFFKHLYSPKDKIKINCSFLNGTIHLWGQDAIKNCSAHFKINHTVGKGMGLDSVKDCLVSCSFDVCHKNQLLEHCFLFGKLVGDKGHFKIKGSKDLIAVNIYKDATLVKISSLLQPKLLKNLISTHPKIRGTAMVNCCIDTRLQDVAFWQYKVRAKLSEFSIRDKLSNHEIRFEDLRVFAHNSNDLHRLQVRDYEASHNMLDVTYNNKKIYGQFKGSSLLQKLVGYHVICDLFCEGEIKDDKFFGKLGSSNLRINLPKVYNVIKKLDAEIQADFYNRTLYIKKLFLSCHKGLVTMHNVLVDTDLKKPLVIPFGLSDFFFSLDKNFFVYLNGQSTLICAVDSEGTRKLSLAGNLQVTKGGIKYGFSQYIKNANYSKNEFDINLDLIIDSKNITMSHKFFKVTFGCKLMLQGSMQWPHISGMVNIIDGIIKFPTKDLVITNAQIYVSDEGTILDISAQATINKHDITMRILGPVSNPKILFESKPLLSTEEIISLLVTGSPSTALSCFLPNLLINNFSSLISGTSSDSKNYEPGEYIQQILTILKNIKIAPARNDQNSKNGNYTFEFGIADGLRATINNDLTFQQPQRIGLEYDLSNCLTIKGSKDRDNNLAGELEVTWKI